MLRQLIEPSLSHGHFPIKGAVGIEFAIRCSSILIQLAKILECLLVRKSSTDTNTIEKLRIIRALGLQQ
jgi:hypothetical protein